MNWEAISAIGQIVGALAVVVSLIYLAREIRSNARSARVASLHDINRWFGELVEHPHLGELYYCGIHDFASLESADLVRFGALMCQLFYLHQELYYQQLDGHLDPRLSDGLDAVMRDINANPGVQAWWRSYSHWFGEEFVRHVNQLQRDRAKTAARLRQLAKMFRLAFDGMVSKTHRQSAPCVLGGSCKDCVCCCDRVRKAVEVSDDFYAGWN